LAKDVDNFDFDPRVQASSAAHPRNDAKGAGKKGIKGDAKSQKIKMPLTLLKMP
jgi:hypothetical protein